MVGVYWLVRVAMAEARATTTRRRVLLVEDHDDTAEVLTLLIARLGHAIETVPSRLDVRGIARRFDPDVVILDYEIPDPKGLDALRTLRDDSRCPDRFVAVISGWSRPQDYARAREAGADEYIVKPLSLVKLEAILQHSDSRRHRTIA